MLHNHSLKPPTKKGWVAGLALCLALGAPGSAPAGETTPAGDVDLTYEYEEIWDYVPNVEGCKCKIPAYTVEMKARHTRVLLALPWVQPTPSADEEGVLGRSHGWPAGKTLEYAGKTFEPDIPPQEIFGYQITNPEAEGPKTHVVLASGNHPHEHMGCWVLEGMVNFLAGGDPRAKALRDKAVFFVYPMVNPDGRVFHLHGVPRYTYARFAGSPELYAAGVANHNRVWNTTGRFRSIDIVTAAMKKDTLRARSLPTCRPRTMGIGPGRLRHWVMQEEGLSVPASFTHEPSMHYDRELAAEAGKTLALAFYDVLGPPPPPPVAVMPPEPTSAWDFDGDAAPRFGEVAGTATKAAWSTDVPPAYDGKRSFDNATGRHVDLDANLTSTDALTVSVWAKGPPADSNRYIVGQWWSGAPNQRSWAIVAREGRFQVWLSSDGTWDSGKRVVYKSAKSDVWDDTWRHLAFTYEGGGSGTLRVFLGGVELTRGNLLREHVASVPSLYRSEGVVRVGARAHGADRNPLDYFDGLTVGLALWDAVLSPDQIFWLSQNGMAAISEGNR